MCMETPILEQPHWQIHRKFWYEFFCIGSTRLCLPPFRVLNLNILLFFSNFCFNSIYCVVAVYMQMHRSCITFINLYSIDTFVRVYQLKLLPHRPKNKLPKKIRCVCAFWIAPIRVQPLKYQYMRISSWVAMFDYECIFKQKNTM